MSNKSNLIGQIQIKLNYYQAAQPLDRDTDDRQ